MIKVDDRQVRGTTDGNHPAVTVTDTSDSSWVRRQKLHECPDIGPKFGVGHGEGRFEPDHTGRSIQEGAFFVLAGAGRMIGGDRSANTPFEGRTVRGKVRHTIWNGDHVVNMGEATR